MVKYSVLIGLWKSIKNVAITVGIPAVLVLLNNYADWLPTEYNSVAIPVMAIISYMIKNKVSFKG